MKKKTGTITFHASHNYGSMLQAYALQQTLLSLGVDNEIINYRTITQRRMYSNPYEKRDGVIRNITKNLIDIVFPTKRQRIKKYNLFEEFLNKRLILSKEISTHEELTETLPIYDYYITGSDQCWNTRCNDFEWAYYLDFTNSPNKISYASSMGSRKHDVELDKIKSLLHGYKAISTREHGTEKIISDVVGSEVEVLPDPTFLLSSEKWKSMLDEKPIVDYPYIFIYSPHFKEGFNETAVKISNELQLPIVISNLTSFRKDVILNFTNRNVSYKLEVGPEEFLNLIYNSELVICGSFHALVFSIIFHKPFFAFNGKSDNRMNGILTALGFDSRSITPSDYTDKLRFAYDVDFDQSDNNISNLRKKAISFLKSSLDL